MRAMASGVGLIPEQAWELPDLAPAPFGSDPTTASIGFRNGKPAGSASALTWSMGQFVRLVLDLSAGRVLDRQADTFDRYVRHRQGRTTLALTSPTDLAEVGPSVTVAGTSAAGNRIVIAASNIDEDTATTTTTTTAGPDGSFSVDIPLTGGTYVLNVVATSAAGDTARAVRTVAFPGTPGPLLFQADDPLGDDDGPGTYAYPTDSQFHAGAFDIEQFQVFDTGASVTFRLRTRDLTPTFGSPLGAQLVDVYAHDPAAAQTSTAASFPQRNYAIADAGAWSRLIEVQGFGSRFIDAGGATVGSVTIRANAITRYITFSVPKAALGGTPAAGWAFTVVLTGQDGFSPDQARGFQPTPQPFQFGVCAAGNADPRCAFDPGRVPKAVDVLTPAGTLQSAELDYTAHAPVVLAPVAVGP
jgi:glucoamylase